MTGSEGRKLRAAVIGLGSMGANHARVYGDIEGVELAAVADRSPDRLLPFAAAASYDNYSRMLRDEQLDLVSICVPTLLHREVALAAIERGVAMLVEKPIAATLEEGREMARAAREAGAPLMVGHIERFNPAVREVKRLLSEGWLGRVLQVSATRTGPFPARVRDVGVVHDLAPHDIDVMSFLLASPVLQVYAETISGVATEHEDLLAGVLRFQNEVVGVLDVNWLTPLKARRLAVLGEKGLLEADYLAQEVRFYPKGEAPAPDVIHVERAEPLRLELEAFVEAVREGRQPPVTAEDGLSALEIASALVESAQRGEALPLEPRRAG